MSKKKPVWRTLRVGDKVCLIEMPPEFSLPGYVIFSETLRVYKKLLGRNRPLRVYMIDEYKHPWINCRFRRRDGSWEEHILAINHDGIRRVKSRR